MLSILELKVCENCKESIQFLAGYSDAQAN